ncbi:MAG TPA: glycosyl transferase, partial [Candidatus Kerfeldbacteria bacterium]|nr:glycosyl transferase [Candidatus Kerfeldbacteria bacterium]
RPVFAYRSGGAREIIQPGVTGDWFDFQTWEDLADMIVRVDPKQYDPARIQQQANTYSTQRFEQQIKTFVDSAYHQFTQQR